MEIIVAEARREGSFVGEVVGEAKYLLVTGLGGTVWYTSEWLFLGVL